MTSANFTIGLLTAVGMVLFIFYLTRKRKRFRLIKALEENGGEWKMRFEVPYFLRLNPRESKEKAIINPSNGKKYKWNHIKKTNDKNAFMEITYLLILNPGNKSDYSKSTILYLP